MSGGNLLHVAAVVQSKTAQRPRFALRYIYSCSIYPAALADRSTLEACTRWLQASEPRHGSVLIHSRRPNSSALCDYFSCHKFLEAWALFPLGMTPLPNGLSLGNYRERLSHYNDAENEKNEMIRVRRHPIFWYSLSSLPSVMVGAHRQLGESSDGMQTDRLGSGEWACWAP